MQNIHSPKPKYKVAIGITATFLLVGCGGGSSSSPSPAPQQCLNTQYLEAGTCRAKNPQSIRGFSLPPLTVGSRAILTATATSGLSLIYNSNTPQTCSVANNEVSAIAAGECTVAANQAGDQRTLAATQMVASNLIYPRCSEAEYLDALKNTCQAKAAQNVTGLSLPALRLGESITLTAVADSGLPVSYTSKTISTCRLEGSKLIAIRQGVCTVSANQLGSVRVLPAAETTVSTQVRLEILSQLSKTGITTCGNSNANNLNCDQAALGSLSSFKQDGQTQTGYKMEYVLLTHQQDECLLDGNSGLVWEKKNWSDVNSIRYYDKSFTWYNSNAKTNGGNTGIRNKGFCETETPSGRQCDTQGYIAELNANRYCGYDDWRIPSITEIETIVDYGHIANRFDMFGFIDATITPSTSSVWLATPSASRSDTAWSLNIDTGRAHGFAFKDNALRLLAVRGGRQ